MKTVLLDCDGVIADFVTSYLALLNRFGGTNYTNDDVSDWDIVECLRTPKHVEDAANSLISYDFCRGLSALSGAADGVKELMKVSDLYIITSPWGGCKGWTNAREEWLYQYCGIKSGRILHGSAKHLLDGDIFVDDKASTVHKWAATHPGRTAVIWDQPWNRNAEVPDAVRTRSWELLLEMAK